MRTVLAFQGALRAVRRANPDLIIENCQNGGHIINELTLLATQHSWLLDEPGSDLPDARSNIQVALGALEFMPPSAAYRWTNRLDEHGDDDEFTRYYCRSAMAGVWGISTDLSAVSDHQRSVILNEIQNYRRLNNIKKYNHYEILQPADGADAASITFYADRSQEAAAIVYRWRGKAAFTQQLYFKGLDKSISYVITDTDTGLQTTITGQQLAKTGFQRSFAAGQLSALLFVEPAKR
jgi:alpha-galactosidase